MSKPAFLKTYGKQKRRLEKWFSPDLRKKVFSFSSTPSSDQSVSELPSRKRNKKNSTTSDDCRSSRTAKRKAMEALKELDSDENSFIQENAPRRKPKPSTKPVKKAAVTRRSPGMHGSSKENHASQFTLRLRKQPVLSSSENDSDLFEIKKKCSNACRQHSSSNFRHTKEGDSVVLPRVDGFVTKRRKVLRVQSEKQSFEQSLGSSSNALNTSKDFTSFPRYVTNRKPPTTQPEANMKPPVMFHTGTYNHSGTVLHEVSFNDVEEQMMSCKLPLLCSTPSLVSKRNVHSLEPSIIELSSLSCDEIDKPPSINESTVKDLMSKPQKHGMLRKSKECAKQIQKTQTENADDKNRTCSDGEVVSAGPHLKQVKERAVIMLEKLDVSDKLSNQSDDGKQEVEKTYSPSLEAASATAMLSRCGDQTSQMSSYYATSDRSTRASHLTTSLSPSSLSGSSLSAPPAHKHSSSLQKQIDSLKVECLSSCLTVCLQRLDLRNIRQSHGEIIKTHETQVASTPSLARGQNASNPNNLSSLVDTESGEQSSQGELRTEGLVRRLSNSFMLSAISPEPVTAPSKVPVSKERTGHCPSRKACVSGLNSSRWSRRGTSNQPRKQRHNETRTKPGDCSTYDLLPTGADSYIGESAYGWLQSRGTGLPKTPLSVERLNLSSFLTSFTPDSLTTHTWGRLKAALSIHKKKKAIPTPQRLALSNLKYSGLVDTSIDLFGTPASAHTLCSRITNGSMISCNEDISDAEKVYQECQQEGPVSFDDCIPPESMKHCIKIGEGTFGEVFSVVNDAEQTVALKIIPVEGQEKVNGEPQKSLGEVLHEIIISKELSALNTKEHNQTNGFIGLINLHCVRGCYPSALLNAWDKFDQEKGSENDRPDFFDKEQLFLILEFEFGGTDLENLNGKLISMAQAKSVLHQVTAALAVAEEALCFEHRDLHWGNILLKNTKQKHNQFILNGSVQSIETRGVHVNIIDYSLSRLEIDGLTVSCDIANEEELFMGQGDYQFEVYRLMKKENNNCWTVYKPHSNVLWLHYLADKLLNMRYRNKPKTSQQKALKGSLKSFHSEVLNYHSAKDVLMNSPLFQ